MKLVPATKEIKSTAISGGELLAGFVGAHAIRTQIKSDKKWINPLAALVSLYAHCSVSNKHAKDLLLGGFGYYGIKSLNDLKTVATNAMNGVEGMDGFREILNNIVPSLGEADINLLSGSDLAAAEEELLGLMAGAEFTDYTEVSSKQVGSAVSNL
jgi:hypothetical protein